MQCEMRLGSALPMCQDSDLDSKGEIMHSKNNQNYNSCFLKEICGRKKGKSIAKDKICYFHT